MADKDYWLMRLIKVKDNEIKSSSKAKTITTTTDIIAVNNNKNEEAKISADDGYTMVTCKSNKRKKANKAGFVSYNSTLK